jgi:hypothetical protein
MNKKWSFALCDEEGGEYLHLSESEENLSDSELDAENELDDRALLDAVVNDGRSTEDFVWENMQNYKGKRENFTDSVQPQFAARHVTEIMFILNRFFF